MNSLLAMREAIARGFGIGPLPCFLGDGAPSLERMRKETISTAEIWIVTHPDLARTPRVRAVMEFLVNHFGREGPRLRG